MIIIMTISMVMPCMLEWMMTMVGGRGNYNQVNYYTMKWWIKFKSSFIIYHSIRWLSHESVSVTLTLSQCHCQSFTQSAERVSLHSSLHFTHITVSVTVTVSLTLSVKLKRWVRWVNQNQSMSHWMTHSLTHSLSQSLSQSLTHSVTHCQWLVWLTLTLSDCEYWLTSDCEWLRYRFLSTHCLVCASGELLQFSRGYFHYKCLGCRSSTLSLRLRKKKRCGRYRVKVRVPTVRALKRSASGNTWVY